MKDASVLAAPSPAFARRMAEAIDSWSFRTVLDEQGRKKEGVVGYGVRFRPLRVLASFDVVEHVGIDVDAAPAPGHPAQYVVTVIITDLDTAQIIGAPKITARAGEEATVRSGFTSPNDRPTQFEMRLLISKDGKAVDYSWRLVRDGKVVSKHSAEFEF